ncbi:unnamed protein product [Nippostrongylus brasiliensis]|uniref:Sushi domain-containing protein n=1 Tax=Nippostrongylus brasiliensis TaxID=27835 RepID=A0A0N4Y4K2_NIPBR|nr:unnamed protein product [Nippostrongylus brasiliensis]
MFREPAQLPNDDTKDCLFLDYTYTTTGPYRLADCRVKQTFICQKHNNWSTVVADSQHQRVRSGFKVSTVNYTIWLLILVALILLCIVFCILYQACIKKRGQNRVHSTESNRLVRGLGIMSPPQLDAAPAKEQQDVLVNYRSDGSRSQIAPQLSPVRADVHLSSADTNPSVLPKLVDETELKACDHQREGSFLKSKRTAELFDRPKMEVLENVSAISLDDFWSSTKE